MYNQSIGTLKVSNFFQPRINRNSIARTFNFTRATHRFALCIESTDNFIRRDKPNLFVFLIHQILVYRNCLDQSSLKLDLVLLSNLLKKLLTGLLPTIELVWMIGHESCQLVILVLIHHLSVYRNCKGPAMTKQLRLQSKTPFTPCLSYFVSELYRHIQSPNKQRLA